MSACLHCGQVQDAAHPMRPVGEPHGVICFDGNACNMRGELRDLWEERRAMLDELCNLRAELRAAQESLASARALIAAMNAAEQAHSPDVLPPCNGTIVHDMTTPCPRCDR